jgi:hypothetical protein
VRFACRAKLGFDAEVDLERTASEPATPTCGQRRGLFQLVHAEKACPETSALVLAAGRYG